MHKNKFSIDCSHLVVFILHQSMVPTRSRYQAYGTRILLNNRRGICRSFNKILYILLNTIKIESDECQSTYTFVGWKIERRK